MNTPAHRHTADEDHTRRTKSHNTVYTGTDPYAYIPPPVTGTTSARRTGPHNRCTPIAPNRDIVDATELLLSQPDAYLHRRRYLALITNTPGLAPDYRAAERYLLTTAHALQKTLRRRHPNNTAQDPHHQKTTTPNEPT